MLPGTAAFTDTSGIVGKGTLLQNGLRVPTGLLARPAPRWLNYHLFGNDVERLKQLLAEYPTLLSWQSNDRDGGLLGIRYQLLR